MCHDKSGHNKKVVIRLPQKISQPGDLARSSSKKNETPRALADRGSGGKAPEKLALNIFGTTEPMQVVGGLDKCMADDKLVIKCRADNSPSPGKDVFGKCSKNTTG